VTCGQLDFGEVLRDASGWHGESRRVEQLDDGSVAPSSSGVAVPVCGWCRGRLGGRRSDTIYCGQKCRQAAWRFGRGCPRVERATTAMRFGYADPPYPGKAHLYRDHPDFAGEVDHQALIDRLVREYPDGWALSTSATPGLRLLLPMCPDDVRVASWHRGERPVKSYAALNGWEPVIYWGGRFELTEAADRRVDTLEHVSRPRTSDPDHVIGEKPAEFWWWLFGLLNAKPGDAFEDLFRGSGGGSRAWQVYNDRCLSDVQEEACK
jgi:hypothetical protein